MKLGSFVRALIIVLNAFVHRMLMFCYSAFIDHYCYSSSEVQFRFFHGCAIEKQSFLGKCRAPQCVKSKVFFQRCFLERRLLSKFRQEAEERKHKEEQRYQEVQKLNEQRARMQSKWAESSLHSELQSQVLQQHSTILKAREDRARALAAQSTKASPMPEVHTL